MAYSGENRGVVVGQMLTQKQKLERLRQNPNAEPLGQRDLPPVKERKPRSSKAPKPAEPKKHYGRKGPIA